MLRYEGKSRRESMKACVIYKAQGGCPDTELVDVCDTMTEKPHASSNNYNEVTFTSPNHDESRKSHRSNQQGRRRMKTD